MNVLAVDKFYVLFGSSKKVAYLCNKQRRNGGESCHQQKNIQDVRDSLKLQKK